MKVEPLDHVDETERRIINDSRQCFCNLQADALDSAVGRVQRGSTINRIFLADAKLVREGIGEARRDRSPIRGPAIALDGIQPFLNIGLGQPLFLDSLLERNGVTREICLPAAFIGDRLIDSLGTEPNRTKLLRNEGLELALCVGNHVPKTEIGALKSEQPDLGLGRTRVSLLDRRDDLLEMARANSSWAESRGIPFELIV